MENKADIMQHFLKGSKFSCFSVYEMNYRVCSCELIAFKDSCLFS
jgi:hypothetical protein